MFYLPNCIFFISVFIPLVSDFSRPFTPNDRKVVLRGARFTWYFQLLISEEEKPASTAPVSSLVSLGGLFQFASFVTVSGKLGSLTGQCKSRALPCEGGEAMWWTDAPEYCRVRKKLSLRGKWFLLHPLLSILIFPIVVTHCWSVSYPFNAKLLQDKYQHAFNKC